MCFCIKNAFDESIKFVKFLKLHVDFLEERGVRRKIMHELHQEFCYSFVFFVTYFMEFIFKLESTTTCSAHCRQQLCHWKNE